MDSKGNDPLAFPKMIAEDFSTPEDARKAKAFCERFAATVRREALREAKAVALAKAHRWLHTREAQEIIDAIGALADNTPKQPEGD